MQVSRRERSWKSVLTVHLDNQRNKKESKGGRSGYRRKRSFSLLILAFCFFLSSCQIRTGTAGQDAVSVSSEQLELEELPEYEGDPYVEIDEGEPDFSEAELTTDSYEMYSDLDELGRCQSAEACVGTDLMPDEEREDIGQIKPSGWQTIKYDNVDGKYLYNRCHLIGYQLTAENANEKNLITGTRIQRECFPLKMKSPIMYKIQRIMLCTGLHQCLRGIIWWPPVCGWRLNPWRITEKGFRLMYMFITSSQE